MQMRTVKPAVDYAEAVVDYKDFQGMSKVTEMRRRELVAKDEDPECFGCLDTGMAASYGEQAVEDYRVATCRYCSKGSDLARSIKDRDVRLSVRDEHLDFVARGGKK